MLSANYITHYKRGNNLNFLPENANHLGNFNGCSDFWRMAHCTRIGNGIGCSDFCTNGQCTHLGNFNGCLEFRRKSSYNHESRQMRSVSSGVLAVIVDAWYIDTCIEEVGIRYGAHINQATDYSAFGAPLPGRTWYSGKQYRLSFNEKETDSETALQDYGMRIYNQRLGRFLSVDPRTKSYPWYTPYSFAGNKPLRCIDLDGCEEFDKSSWGGKGELGYSGFLGGLSLHNPNSLTLEQEVTNSIDYVHGQEKGILAGFALFGLVLLPELAVLPEISPELTIGIWRAGLTGGAVSGTISAINQESAYDITKSIITGFVGGAVLGGGGSLVKVGDMLGRGFLSGVMSEYTDQVIDNEISKGGQGYDFKKILAAGGLGSASTFISGKIIEGINTYVNQQVDKQITETETNSYFNTLKNSLKKDNPNISEKDLNSLTKGTITGIQTLIKKQGELTKVALTKVVEGSAEDISKELSKRFPKK